jgi:hypothetical protein
MNRSSAILSETQPDHLDLDEGVKIPRRSRFSTSPVRDDASLAKATAFVTNPTSEESER